jgi:hypothetical protein
MCIASLLVGLAVTGCFSSTSTSTSTSTGAGASQTTSTSTGSSETTSTSAGSSRSTSGTSAPKATAALPLPPVARESINDAEKRIKSAVASGDCGRIAALAPPARPPADETTYCKEYTTQLKNAEATGSQSFGDAAGVIDYTKGSAKFSIVLVVDQDGLYHPTFINRLLGEPTVRTQFARQFNAAARDAFQALASQKCGAFLAIADRDYGPGALPRDQACQFVATNSVASIVEAKPKASFKLIGGNSDYAFYRIAGPADYYTVVMARQSNQNRPNDAKPLPKNAAAYSFSMILPTTGSPQTTT